MAKTRDEGEAAGHPPEGGWLPPGMEEGEFLRGKTRYEAEIGDRERFQPVRPVRPLTGRTETIVISDLHIPEDVPCYLQTVLHRHGGQDHRLVIAGDLFDFTGMGRWPGYQQRQPAMETVIARADAVLAILAELFASVELMWGNHDVRFAKRADKANRDSYVWDLHLARYYFSARHGVRLVNNRVQAGGGGLHTDLFHWHQVGDCLISHLEKSGAPIARGVEKAADWFMQWESYLELAPWTGVLHAHTHQQARARGKYGKQLVEIGCMCGVPGYTVNANSVWSPPSPGYFQLVQYDGVTDWRESRLHELPTVPELKRLGQREREG